MSSILVLEDEQDIRALLCEVLELDGYAVIAVGHPDQLDAVLWETAPDLFLLDLMLHGTTGIEIAQRLRGSGFADKPIIAMTASDLMVRVARESGVFDAILHKPFGLDELSECIQRCFSRQAGGAPAGLRRYP